MTSNWFTRTIARIVLGAYLTQLFAPVVYACENEKRLVNEQQVGRFKAPEQFTKRKSLIKQPMHAPQKTQSRSVPELGNIKVVFEKIDPISPSMQTSYRLKMVQETANNQFQEIIKDFKTEDKSCRFAPMGWSSPSHGLKIKVTSSGKLQVISTQKNNQFTVNFDMEGKVVLQEINSVKHIDLQTFGSIHTADKTIKSHKLSLMGTSFHNNHNFFVNYLNLTLGTQNRPGKFTNIQSAYFSIGKEAHVHRGHIENQGTIKGHDGSFLNLYGNNFVNKHLDQKKNDPFGSQVIWEGQFSILNGGKIHNESKILPQKQNGTGVLPLHTQQGAMLYIDTKELNNLKNAAILANRSLSIHCSEDFINEGRLSSQHGITTLGIFGKPKDTSESIQKVININKGTIYGKNKVDLTISHELINEGNVVSAHTVDIQGKGILKNALDGNIQGKERLHLRKIHLNNQGKLFSEQLIDLYYLQNIENKTTGIFFSPTIQIQGSTEPSNEGPMEGSTKFSNDGSLQGDEQIKIIIPEFKNQGKLLSERGSISLIANQATNAEKATISAKKDIILKIKKSLKNQGDIKADKTTSLEGLVLENSGTISGINKVGLTIAHEFSNEGNVVSAHTVNIQGQGILKNALDGNIQGKERLHLHKIQLNNEGKLLSGKIIGLYYLQGILENKTTGAFFSPNIHIEGSTELSNEGCIQGDEQIKLIIPDFRNWGKLLSNQGSVLLTGNYVMNAEKASILAKKDIIVKIKKSLKNQGDIKAGKTTSLKGLVLGNSGTINGIDGITLILETLGNQGEISGKNLQLTIWDLVNEGTLESDQKFTLNIKNKATNHKTIKAKALDINGNYFENLSSEITNSNGSDNVLDEFTTNLKKLKNKGKILTKSGSIKTKILENQNTIIATKDLKITIQNFLRNGQGAYIGSGELTFFGKGKLQNDNGAKIESGGLLSSHIAGVENEGQITSKQAISFFDLIKPFENRGYIASDQSIALKSKSILLNKGEQGIIEGENGPVTLEAEEITNHGLIRAINGPLGLTMNKGENAHILYGNDGVAVTIGELFKNSSFQGSTPEQKVKHGVVATPQNITLGGKGKLENKAILRADKAIVSEVVSFENQNEAKAPLIHIRNGTNAGNLNSETLDVGEALANNGHMVTKNISGNGILNNLGRIQLAGEEKNPSQISIKAFENGQLNPLISEGVNTKQGRLVSSFVIVTPTNEKFLSHEKAKIWGEKFIFENSPKKIIENNGYFKTNILGINHEGVTFVNGPQAVLKVNQSLGAHVGSFQNEGRVKSQGSFSQEKGIFINRGNWNHKGNINLGATVLGNKGTLLWHDGKWIVSEKGFTNKGTWILDKMICSQPLTMHNYGILHLKDGVVTFENLINHNQLILTKGCYTFTGTLENNHLISFLENDWVFTDNSGSIAPNRLVLKGNAVKKYNSSGEIEVKKNLAYDVAILPKNIHSEGEVMFSSRHQRTLDDLEKVKASGKVVFYSPALTTQKNYEFSGIGHLVLYINGLFTTCHSFKAPALTLEVNGPLTCGASNEIMGTIAATHGPLNMVAHNIDNRFGQMYGKARTHLKSTRGDILVGAAVSIQKGSALVDQHKHFWFKDYNSLPPQFGIHTWHEQNGAYVSSGETVIIESPTKILVDYGQIYSQDSQMLQAGELVRNTAALMASGNKIVINSPEYHHTRANVVISNGTIPYHINYAVVQDSPGSKPALLSALDDIELNVKKVYNTASDFTCGKSIWVNGSKLTKENSKEVSEYIEQPQTFYNRHWGYQLYSGYGEPAQWTRWLWIPVPIAYTQNGNFLSADDIYMDMGKFVITGDMNAGNIAIRGKEGLISTKDRRRLIQRPSKTLLINFTDFIKNEAETPGFLKITNTQEITTQFLFGTPHSLPQGQMLTLASGNVPPVHFDRSNIFNSIQNLSSGVINLLIQKALAQHTGKVYVGEEGKGKNLDLTLWKNNQKLRQKSQTDSITRDQLINNAKEALLIQELQQSGNGIHQITYLAIPPHEFNETRGIVGDNISIHTGGDLTLENAKVTGKKLVNFFSEKQLKFLSTITTRVNGNVTQDFLDSPVEVECTEGPLIAIGKEGFQMTGAKLKSLLRLLVGSTKGNTKIENVLLNRTEKSEQVEDGGVFGDDKVTQTINVSTTSKPSELSSGQEEVIVVSHKESGTTSITGSLLKSIVAILFEGKKIETQAGVGNNSTTTNSQTSGLFSSSQSHSVNQNVSFFPNQFESPNIYTNTEIADYHGTDFIADIIYDNTKEGAKFRPTTAWLEFFQQMVTESPFLTSDVGCKGGYEVMQPCRLLVNKIIRNIDDGQIELESVEWDKNRTEIIGKFAETTYQLKQWQTSWNKTEQLIPDEALVVVALGITIATQGWGTSFAASTLNLGVLGSQMFGVGLSSVCSQMGTSFLREGDPLKAAATVFSDRFIRSLGTNLVTTALLGGGGGIEGFTQHLMHNALRAVVKSGVSSVIEKRDFGETLKEEGLEGVVHAIGASIVEKIGKAASSEENPLSYVEHKLAHFAVGAGMGAILNRKDPLRGAITSGAGAAIGEMVAESICDRQQVMQEAVQETKKECGQFNPVRYKEIYRSKIQNYIDISRLVAGSVLAAFKQDPSLGISSATIALENNFATVPEPEMSLLVSEVQEMKVNKIDGEETEEKSKKNTRKTKNKQNQLKTRSNEKVKENSVSEYLELLNLQNMGTHQHQGLYLEMAQEKEEERGRTRDRIQLTSDQEEMRQKYHERLDQIFENDDGIHRSYTTTATMLESQLLREGEKKGVFIKDEKVLRKIFTHRRSPSPTRTDKGYIENAKITLKKSLPQSVKDAIKNVVGIAEQGGRYVYHQLPEGSQKVIKGSLQFLGQVNESIPTTVRQGLRDLGFSQGFAQDCGDLISFGQWFAPGVGSIKYATKGTNLSKGTKVLRSSVVESLDLAELGTSLIKKLESSHLATKILEKIGTQNHEKLTNKMFSFVHNEHGGGRGFGGRPKNGNKEFKSPLSNQTDKIFIDTLSHKESQKLITAQGAPNAGGSIISFVTKKEEVYYRVYTKRSTGAFLTKQRPKNRAIAIEGLALPPENTAKFIQKVIVPAGTRLQRSRALPIPEWKKRGGMEQFQLLEEIPRKNFKKGKKFK